MSLTLTLPYPPSANRLKAIVRGHMVKTKEARDFAQKAGWIAMKAKARPLTGPVSVSMMVYRPRRSGDLDNTFKAILDALKGIAWIDDSQVVEIHASRLEDKEDPRVVVTIDEGL